MSVGHDPSGLVAGNEYEVENVEVNSWYTLVKLAGVDGWYNSVLFSELDGYEPVKDSPSKRAWLGTPQPGDWD
jgi:hypothetical protein